MIHVYLAAPFFNPAQLTLVQDLERLFATYHNISVYSPRNDGVLIDMTTEQRSLAKRKIFLTNCLQIDRCDIVFAVIDGRDAGVIWEMGYAYAKSKHVITFSDMGYGVNVMLAEGSIAHVLGKKNAVKLLSELSEYGIDVLPAWSYKLESET
jgi:nucleoside deoxyribosyltransferase